MRMHLTIAGLVLTLGFGASGAAGALGATRTDGPLCDSSGACIGATSFNIHQKGWRLKTLERQPRRYACDSFGWNCRYTRAYFISDDGNARWDPGLEGSRGSELGDEPWRH